MGSEKISKVDEIAIRLYYLKENGIISDSGDVFGLADFAGIVPAVGDEFLYPFVMQGLDRYDPENREMLTVVRRIFNPRDRNEYVMLICTCRSAAETDIEMVPQG